MGFGSVAYCHWRVFPNTHPQGAARRYKTSTVQPEKQSGHRVLQILSYFGAAAYLIQPGAGASTSPESFRLGVRLVHIFIFQTFLLPPIGFRRAGIQWEGYDKVKL